MYIALEVSDVAHPCASFLSIAISNILRVICFQVADGGNPLVKCYSCNCPSTWGSDAPLLWTCRSCPETSCNIDECRFIQTFGMIKWFILIQNIAGIESYSYTAILQLTVVFFPGKPYDPHGSSTPPFVWSMKRQLQPSFTPHFGVVEVVTDLILLAMSAIASKNSNRPSA